MALLIPQSAEDFPAWGPPIQAAANAAVEWLVITLGDGFEAFSNAILRPLVWLDLTLRAAPPWLVLLVIGFLGLAAARRWLLPLGVVAGGWLIGAVGLWDEAMQTVAIVLIAVALAILVGIPIGVLAAASDRTKAVISPALDLMQTIPSFVYLIPVAMLFGLGKVPAVIATVIYAMPPLIRLTDLGLRQIGGEIVEASRAFGATRWQILAGVRFPLALPSIMQGINQTTMMALAMVVIASMIGARGVGYSVLLGLQQNDFGKGLTAGLSIVVLAIIFDRISQAFGRRLQAHRAVRS